MRIVHSLENKHKMFAKWTEASPGVGYVDGEKLTLTLTSFDTLDPCNQCIENGRFQSVYGKPEEIGFRIRVNACVFTVLCGCSTSIAYHD